MDHDSFRDQLVFSIFALIYILLLSVLYCRLFEEPVNYFIAIIYSFIFLSVLPAVVMTFWEKKASVSGSESLRRTIGDVDLEDVRLGSPEVIATLAIPPILNPADPTGDYPSRRAIVRYTKLSQLTDAEQVANVLLATAALPGLFPPHEFGYVDGSIANNTPILAVVDEQTTHIIVVYLDDQIGDTMRDTWKMARCAGEPRASLWAAFRSYCENAKSYYARCGREE